MQTYRLAIPYVWETPHIARFGIDRPVMRWQPHSPFQRGVLHRLERGTHTTELRAFAQACAAKQAELTEVLSHLAPVLTPPALPTAVGRTIKLPRVLVADCSPTGDVTSNLLISFGVDVRRSPRSSGINDAVAIVINRFVYDSLHIESLLHRTSRVIPVCFTDTSVTIGPALTSSGVCASCLNEYVRDTGPVWERWASQIAGKPLPHERAASLHTAMACLMLITTNAPGYALRVHFTAPGTPSSFATHTYSPHPTCLVHEERDVPEFVDVANPASAMKREGST